MKLSYGYLVAPGQCFVCSSAQTGKVIDLDRDDPAVVRRSHVYLCENCVSAAYKMLDPTKIFVEPQVIADKDGEILALTNEVARLMDEASLHEQWLAKAVATQREASDA